MQNMPGRPTSKAMTPNSEHTAIPVNHQHEPSSQQHSAHPANERLASRSETTIRSTITERGTRRSIRCGLASCLLADDRIHRQEPIRRSACGQLMQTTMRNRSSKPSHGIPSASAESSRRRLARPSSIRLSHTDDPLLRQCPCHNRRRVPTTCRETEKHGRIVVFHASLTAEQIAPSSSTACLSRKQP